MNIHENQMAFPTLGTFERYNDDLGRYEEYYAPEGGMTLRDYFAIQLLSGDGAGVGEGCEGYMEQRARVAYAYADAMLKAREAK